MAVNPNPMRVINPEDEIFWRKVREAYDAVAANNDFEVFVEYGGRRAEVSYIELNSTMDSVIIIKLTETAPVQPTLIAP